MTYEMSCRLVQEHEAKDEVEVFDYATNRNIRFPFDDVSQMHFNQAGYGTIVVSERAAAARGLI